MQAMIISEFMHSSGTWQIANDEKTLNENLAIYKRSLEKYEDENK